MDIKKLETQYLKAKIEYYEGNPIMEDHEFDSLEQILIKAGSKVHEQVGSKRKDFDFAHPTKMLSLAKIQTEKNKDGSTNYAKEGFNKWFSKNKAIVGGLTLLGSSPKFDGSAINAIYRGNKLFQILTRGDGLTGKDVTKRLKRHFPETLIFSPFELTEDIITEIRCEVVINRYIFEDKYSKEFANARNFVAGVIGKDDMEEEKLNDLTIIPLDFRVNNDHYSHKHFLGNEKFEHVIYENYGAPLPFHKEFVVEDYKNMMKWYEGFREYCEFQLDGVVITFPYNVRKDLGENEHDPEWAIAIKFVPEGAVTTVVGVEWNIGKRGQFTPVVLLEPVQLAGTTVKRASGYNAGFIKDNGIGEGAVVSVIKSGDIIPEIINVISETTKTFELLNECPECGTLLEFDGVHLTCSYERCPGRIAKILATGAGTLDLKGIGSERLKPFSRDHKNIYEVWINTLVHGEDFVANYGLEKGSRLNEIFVQAFKNIKSIPYEKVIQILGYENVGRKISQQLAREHAGLDFNYASLERALVEKVHTAEVESYIKGAVSDLEALGVIVDRPEAPKEDSGAIGVTLTGSPKTFGFKTKAEFLAKYPNLYEVDLKDAIFLVTDDMNSTSSKMKNAQKKGIKIKTYGDF